MTAVEPGDTQAQEGGQGSPIGEGRIDRHPEQDGPPASEELGVRQWLPVLRELPAAPAPAGAGRRVAPIVAGAIAVVVIVGFMWASRSIDEPSAVVPPGVAGGAVIDTFTRPDSEELGASDTGHPWVIASGRWGLEGGQALVAEPEEGVNRAVVDVGSGDMTAAVTISRMVPGAGLVFRYGGPLDHWSVRSVPDVATWQVVKVVGGKGEVVGNLGLAPIADGTTIAVDVRGSQINIRVNGKAFGSFDDGDLSQATSVGLTAVEASAADVRFDHFQASPLTPAADTAG